jgi:transcription initiation factor TFIIIB Brf1 subunit/transcription initiation factor TFIIB
MRNPNDVCSECGVGIYRRPKDKANHPRGFCSECKVKAYSAASLKGAENRYQNFIQRWKNGEERGMRGATNVSAHIVRYLKEKFGNRCSRCGWKEVNRFTDNVPVEVEHKDGDYRNNQEENLDLICPNCHSLTET